MFDDRDESPQDEKPVAKVVLFDFSKKEVHNPKSGFKKLSRKLQAKYTVQTNRDEITPAVLGDVTTIVIAKPREKFSDNEIQALKKFVEDGGSLFVATGDCKDEPDISANLNSLLKDFGVKVNNDSVIRTVYYKYHHPKQAFINDGVVNKKIADACESWGAVKSKGKKNDAQQSHEKRWSNLTQSPASKGVLDHREHADNRSVALVYPNGSTLTVKRPASCFLSSGYIAFPLNIPIGAIWQGGSTGKRDRKEKKYMRFRGQDNDRENSKEGQVTKGRVVVMGSCDMFSDEWIDKEENACLQNVLFSWLLREECAEGIHIPDTDPELNEYNPLPDTAALSERLRSCLQDTDEVPQDFMQLFDGQLFKFDTNLIPEVKSLYEQLGVKKEPLGLIPPQFETPLPPLQPAVFPPTLREPPPPALEKFDLDEQFASEKVRMAQLANKCGNEDIEFFIKESGEILGVGKGTAQNGTKNAMEVLFHVFTKLVDFKKTNYEQVPYSAGLGDTNFSNLDARPDTASAIRAVTDSGQIPGVRPDTASALRAAGADDYRPDTASALRAVMAQEKEASIGGGSQAKDEYGARPDTAAAIRAVQEMEAKQNMEYK